MSVARKWQLSSRRRLSQIVCQSCVSQGSSRRLKSAGAIPSFGHTTSFRASAKKVTSPFTAVQISHPALYISWLTKRFLTDTERTICHHLTRHLTTISSVPGYKCLWWDTCLNVRGDQGPVSQVVSATDVNYTYVYRSQNTILYIRVFLLYF